MSDSFDPNASEQQDNLDYDAGYQARVDGVPFEKGTSPRWFLGWSEADKDLAEKARLDRLPTS